MGRDRHNWWQYEFKERIKENEDAEVQRGDFGEFEEDDSASELEEYESMKQRSAGKAISCL